MAALITPLFKQSADNLAAVLAGGLAVAVEYGYFIAWKFYAQFGSVWGVHSGTCLFGGWQSSRMIRVTTHGANERTANEISKIDNPARAKRWRMANGLEPGAVGDRAHELIPVRQICSPKPAHKRSGAGDVGAGCDSAAGDAGADACAAGSLGNSVLRSQAGISSTGCTGAPDTAASSDCNVASVWRWIASDSFSNGVISSHRAFLLRRMSGGGGCPVLQA